MPDTPIPRAGRTALRKAAAVVVALLVVTAVIAPLTHMGVSNVSPVGTVSAETVGDFVYIGNGGIHKEPVDGGTEDYNAFTSDDITHVRIGPEGTYVYAGNNSGGVIKFYADNGSLVWRKNPHGTSNSILSLAVAPNGNFIAYGYERGGDGRMRKLFSNGTTDCTFTESDADTSEDDVSELAITNDSKYIFGGGSFDALWKWNADDCTETSEFGQDKGTGDIDGLVANTDNTLYAADGQKARAYYINNGSLRWSTEFGTNSVKHAVALSQNESILYVGNDGGQVHQAQASDGTEITTIGLGVNSIEDVETPTDNTGFFVASSDNNVSHYDSSMSLQWEQNYAEQPVTLSVGLSTFDVTSKVSGTVKDLDGNTIEGASITINASSKSDTTASDGSYSVNLQNGNYKLTASKSGYNDGSTTVTVSGSALTNQNITLSQDTVSGTVVNQHGNPVENATVVGVAYDHADYDSKIDKAREKINDVQEKLRNPEPPDWQSQLDSGFSFTGPGGKLRTSTEPWILMHTQAQWQRENVFFPGGGGQGLLSDPDLDQPIGFSTQLHAPADEPIILTPWDPNRGNDIAENDIDSDLPGAAIPPSEASDIVVEQLAPGSNDATNTVHLPVSRRFKAGLPAKPVGYVRWNPAPGFYRIYPEGHPDNAVIYTVGKPSAIVQPYVRNLKNEKENLADTAQTYQNRISNGTITRFTDTTNADGDFSFSVDSRFDEVDVFAYKVPPGLDPQTATREDVREYYSNLDTDAPDAPNNIQFDGTRSAVNATSGADLDGLPGAVYLPGKPKSVTPPKSDVSVTVREVSVPDHVPIDKSRNVTDRFRSWLRNLTFSDLPQALQERLNSSAVSREELERLYRNLDRLREQNSRLENRYTELLEQSTDDPQVNVSIDADDATDAELRDRIQKLQRSLTELRSTVTAEDPTVETSAKTVSLRFPFDANLEPENVLVRAQWSNGTTTVLNTSNPHVSIDDSLTGGDTVVISEYPIGENDPAAVNFVVDVAVPTSDTPNGVDEGLGHAEQPVTNPTFDGTVPSLQAIDLSSLRPGPSETVTMTLHPQNPADVGNITSLTVYGPDGTQVNSSVTGENEAEFTTSGAGTHHVSVTFDDPDGNAFTTTFLVKAGDRDQSLPPGLRVVSSPVGVYALTGDGLDAGSVDLSGGGASVTITAQVSPGDEAPQRLQIYGHGLELAPDNELTVRVVQGDSQKALSQTIVLTLHLPALPEGALLRRGEQPLKRDGETPYGAVETNGSATTIRTYTQSDGTVTIRTNADPGLLAQAWHFIELQVGDIDVPVIGVTTPLAPWGIVDDLLGGELV